MVTMNTFTIGKDIRWHMGHRVWTQNIASNIAPNKCRHLHGHEYVLTVEFAISTAIDTVQSFDMVLDYTYYKLLKEFIDSIFDHRFLLDANDPILDSDMFKSLTNYLTKRYSLVFDLSEPVYIDLNMNTIKPNITATKDVITFLRQEKQKLLLAVCIATNDLVDSATAEFIESFVFVNFVPTAEMIGYMFRVLLANLSNNTILSRFGFTLKTEASTEFTYDIIRADNKSRADLAVYTQSNRLKQTIKGIGALYQLWLTLYNIAKPVEIARVLVKETSNTFAIVG